MTNKALAAFLVQAVTYAEAHADDPHAAAFLVEVAKLRAAVDQLTPEQHAELETLRRG